MKNNFLNRILSIFFLTPIYIFCVFKGGFAFNLLIFFLFIFSIFEISKLKLVYSRILLFLIFLTFLYSFYDIRYMTNGIKIIFLITFVTWFSDIGGYLFGKLIGGKKVNFISPNKTISGYCGSIILAQLNLFYIYYFEINIYETFYRNSLFLFFCTLIVIFGDLFFSYFKRLNNLKDYSNLIPGHGGLLDRLDGFIFLVIIFYIMNLII
tara:strand:+ start:759 stop:1385 length:627 start_codon:yes stop_codon:yes gene_type:complete